MVLNNGWALVSLRFSWRMMLCARSTQLAQMYTSDGPSTMGPTSREDFPQKEQVVTRLPRNPLGGLLVLLGGLPLPPPPLPVRRSFGIGRAFLEGRSPR